MATETAPVELARPAQRRPTLALRHELAVFLGAVGLTALHVADDSFIQPQPGPSPEHLIDQVDEIAPRAVLLIHAPEVDNGDEERFGRAYYRAAGEPKFIWGVPEAGHVGAQDARPLEYERRVTRFFDEALGEEQP